MSELSELKGLLSDIFVNYGDFHTYVDPAENGDSLNSYLVTIEDPNGNEIFLSCRYNDSGHVSSHSFEIDTCGDGCCWNWLDTESVWSYMYFEMMQRGAKS